MNRMWGILVRPCLYQLCTASNVIEKISKQFSINDFMRGMRAYNKQDSKE